MVKNHIFIVLCLLCFGTCKSPSQKVTVDDIVIVNIDEALHSPPREFHISDFADSILFVPIYDGNSAYIGDPRIMEMTTDHIFIYDGIDRLICYNFKERKSWQIGVRGRGPGEYLRMETLAADEKNNVIYALIDSPGPGAVYKYDFEGRFLGSIMLEDDADNMGLTEEGDIVVFFTNYFGNSKYQYRVMQGDGTIVTNRPNPFPYQLSGERISYFKESATYNYDGMFHIKGKSDTLYRFKGPESYPKYIFKNSFSIDGRTNLSQVEYDDAFVLNYVFETETKLVFNGTLDKVWRFFYYDKTTGRTYLINRDIPNDLTDHPKYFRQITADTTFGNCYVTIEMNPEREGDPPLEEAPYFLMLLHLK